jgi:signal transduction histidine kinase/chemotaxis methyl-accepting protein methylase/PAS domain-containing protein
MNRELGIETQAVDLPLGRRGSRPPLGAVSARSTRRAVARRMSILGLDDKHEYLRRLGQERSEQGALVAEAARPSFLGFFSDREAWQRFANHVIPRLLERGSPGAVRVWVPWCETGEDAYALVLILAEETWAAGGGKGIRVFATEDDARALEVARRAIYPESALRSLSPNRRRRFFASAEGGFRFAAPLRESVLVASHHLGVDPPFGRLSLVWCRRLPPREVELSPREILELFCYALEPDGILFLAEPDALGAPDLFAPIEGVPGAFTARQGAARVPARRLPVPAWRDPGLRPMGAERLLLERYAPPAVVCEAASLRVTRFLGRTGEFLEPPLGPAEPDLLAMARPGLDAPLRKAVEEARQTGSEARAQAAHIDGSRATPVDIAVHPLGGQPPALLVVFGEPEATAGAEEGAAPERSLAEALKDELRVARAQVSHREGEVAVMSARLERANEELTVANDELLGALEELAAVNRHLTARAEELARARDDMENLLVGSQVAALFVDREQRIRHFTPAMADLARLRSGDEGRPVGDLGLIADWGLDRRARQVLAGGAAWKGEVEADGQVLLGQAHPYRTGQGELDGVVVTLVDITERKRAERALEELTARLEEEVEERTRLVRLLQEVAVIANRSESLREALARVLPRLGRLEPWCAAHAWEVSEEGHARDSGCWFPAGARGFRGLRRAVLRWPDGGLRSPLSRVIERGRPVWLRDLAASEAFLDPVEMPRRRVASALLVPISAGNQVVGVLELFSHGHRAPSAAARRTLFNVGIQLGRVVERERAKLELAEAVWEEQRRTGRALHDGIGQQLAGLSMLARSLAERLSREGHETQRPATEIYRLGRAAHREIRGMAKGLYPAAIEAEADGLQGSLEDLLATTQERFGIECRLQHTATSTAVSGRAATQLFHIAREAVHNAVKHGSPRRIVVSVEPSDDALQLTVEDDGRGIPVETLGAARGIGLRVMRYRADRLGAELEIAAAPEGGTRVTCKLAMARLEG